METVCADSVVKLILTPEKGYSIKSAVITKRNNTCTVSGQEKGANGTYIFTISDFTGDTEISNINIETEKLKVYEYGTDTSTNIGSANLSETSFDSEEEIREVTNAITNKDNINAIINTETNEELDADKQAEIIEKMTKAIQENRDVEIFLEINEETNLEESKENDAKKILEDEIKKDAEEKTGSKVTELKVAMPLDISLFARVQGVENVKVNLKDTNKKEMVIKMKVPSTIKKEVEGIIRSYYVIRFHDGKKDTLPCTYNKNRNIITFKSSKFSTYVLCYADAAMSATSLPRPNTPIIGGGSGSGGSSSGGLGAGGSIATPTPTPTPSTSAPSKPITTSAPSTPAPIATPVPSTPTPTSTPIPDNTSEPSGITKVTIKNVNYKIISSDDIGTAIFTGVKKKVKEVVIPASIKVDNKIYKVLAIAKNALKDDKKVTKVTIGANVNKIGTNAFKGCSKLKKLIIKSKKFKMKNVGKKAFKGINKKATVKVPKGKVKLYKKIIRARGASKKVKVKK